MHTKGPWHVDRGIGAFDRTYVNAGLNRVARCDFAWTEDDGQENARLIAAAPDLLAACEAVLEWARTPREHGGNPYLMQMVKLAERAIEQATGGQVVENQRFRGLS